MGDMLVPACEWLKHHRIETLLHQQQGLQQLWLLGLMNVSFMIHNLLPHHTLTDVDTV